MSSLALTTAREPAKVIGDILMSEMGLIAGQIMIGYQKWNIPTDPNIYIAMIDKGGPMIGSVNEFDSVLLTEVQSCTILHKIQIDILSFDGSARTRKEEIPMALASIYSMRLQEQYHVQIARLVAPFLDTSNNEKTKLLNRFTTEINVSAVHRKTKGADYFTGFAGQITEGGPLNDFTTSVNPFKGE